MKDIPFSGGIREIRARGHELEAMGKKVIHMEVGEPDFDSPECAKRAAIDALARADVHYTDISGTTEFLGELAKYYNRTPGMNVDPNEHIVITCGAVEALYLTYIALLEPDDEVIVIAPYFPAYFDQIQLVGAKIVLIPTRQEDGFALSKNDLERAITPKTRIILINSPNNPSGYVMTESDMASVAEIARSHDLYVIADECYEQFLYEGRHIRMASLPGMAERTITVSSASKTFAMTGWRVGWAIVPPGTQKYFAKAHQNITTCAASFAQAGTAEAFRSAADDVGKMIAEYKRRRDMAMSYINKMNGIKAIVPKGAFYIFPKITVNMNAPEFCRYLLEEALVATVPGDNFGLPGYFRMAYCRSYEDVELAMRKMSDALAKL
jgi:aspartate aminotransferase/aminotransferase